MDTSNRELYFVFGMMAFIIVFATVGLVLFIKYLNRDSRNSKHTEPRQK